MAHLYNSLITARPRWLLILLLLLIILGLALAQSITSFTPSSGTPGTQHRSSPLTLRAGPLLGVYRNER